LNNYRYDQIIKFIWLQIKAIIKETV
jgi:hypothetical protein